MTTPTDDRASRRSSWTLVIAIIALFTAIDAWRQSRRKKTLECEHLLFRSSLAGDTGKCLVSGSGDGFGISFVDDDLRETRLSMYISLKDNAVIVRDTKGTEVARHPLK